ncbi:MAG: tetratricopeptide repeat protein, partial [Syntrophobacterales bacterium]|nr:tetratricopeptide repeat protein [Syntrophobacterales bacterium]
KTLLSPWFALIVIALAAFVIYSNTYNCPFVLDDNHSIKKNIKIRDLSNFSSPERFLNSRTVVDFTFALNYRFGKVNVFGYHLVNILIHIANGFIVYFLALAILRLLFRPSGEEAQSAKSRERSAKRKALNSELTTQNSQFPVMALFAALIFIVHPIQTQAVTYIVQRYASLAAFFYMGSVLFYVKGRVLVQSSKLKEQRAGRKEQGAESKAQGALQPSAFFALSIIFGLLAFMSKQNTASLPGAIILVECMCFGGTWRERARRFLWVAPVFILFVAFVMYAMGLFSGAGIGSMLEDVSELARETELVSRWNYLCTQSNVLVIYIRLLFLPINQNLDYIYPFKTGFLDDLTPLAFAFLAGLAILAVWKRKRYPVVTVAIFWFFITLSVESSIIPIRDALFEHRLYLSMFGFALLAAWLPFRFLPKRRALAVLICIFIVASLGAATYLRNRVWQDGITLWSDVLAKSPRNPRACMSLGNALAAEERYDEAIRCHNRVLRADPDSVMANYNMGVTLEKRGDTDGAVRHYMKALSIDPDYASAHYFLANILRRQGDLEGAVRHYSEVLRINPENARAHSNMGVVLFSMGDSRGAFKHLNEAVRIAPENSDVCNNLGGVLELRGDLEGAARRYTEALVIKPDNTDAYVNLSRVLGRVGDSAVTVRCYREVLRSDPGNIDAHVDLGIALSRMGNMEDAVEHFSEAVRINPEDAGTRYNLGLAFFRQGRIDDAAEQYKKSLRIRPQNPKVHYNLALALHSLGDLQGATSHFEEAVRLDPRLKTREELFIQGEVKKKPVVPSE